jgi:hypothetical protein
LARRVIQFPVRNAFAAQRSRDALARDAEEHDSQEHAHRIAEQVDREIASQAQRQASGRSSEFESARNRNVTMMPQPSRVMRLRKSIASILRALTPASISQR